jgi:hypothetical protein
LSQQDVPVETVFAITLSNGKHNLSLGGYRLSNSSNPYRKLKLPITTIFEVLRFQIIERMSLFIIVGKAY